MDDYAEKLYALKLGEICSMQFCEAMRVPGGWLFIHAVGSNFVPYHNEFYTPNAVKEQG